MLLIRNADYTVNFGLHQSPLSIIFLALMNASC